MDEVSVPVLLTLPNECHPQLAYAVLESQVRITTVSQVLNSTIGYLYVCRPGRVGLVYDLMEPVRPG